MLDLKHKTGANTWRRTFGFGKLPTDQWASASNNRLTDVINGADTHTYEFDPNGNIIRQDTEEQHTWNHADRMIGYRVQPQNAAVASVEARYLYGSDGLRAKKWVRKNGNTSNDESAVYLDSVFEQHCWQERGVTKQNNHLSTMDNSSRVAILGVGERQTDDGTPTVHYHLGDHLGNNAVEVGGDDSTGKDFISREEYFPYGETSLGSFAKKRYRYSDKERDEESGLYYFGARYYSPWLCSWTSCDPLTRVRKEVPSQSVSQYCYVNCTPLVSKDRHGFQDEKATPVVHITDVENVSSIAESGLSPGGGGHDWLGKGVYFNSAETPFASLGAGSQLAGFGTENVVGQWTIDSSGFEKITQQEFAYVESNLEMRAVEEFKETQRTDFTGRTGRIKTRIAELRREYWADRLSGKPGAYLDYEGSGADTGRIYVVRDVARISKEFSIKGAVARKTGSPEGPGMWEISENLSLRGSELVNSLRTTGGQMKALGAGLNSLSILTNVLQAFVWAKTMKEGGYVDVSPGIRFIMDPSKVPDGTPVQDLETGMPGVIMGGRAVPII